MSITKNDSASAPEGSNNNAVSSADVASRLAADATQHSAVVTAIREVIGKSQQSLDVLDLKLVSPELKDKTLIGCYKDRFGNADSIKSGSRVVVNLGTNAAGYPDAVGGRQKNYFVK